MGEEVESAQGGVSCEGFVDNGHDCMMSTWMIFDPSSGIDALTMG